MGWPVRKQDSQVIIFQKGRAGPFTERAAEVEVPAPRVSLKLVTILINHFPEHVINIILFKVEKKNPLPKRHTMSRGLTPKPYQTLILINLMLESD